MIENFTAPVLFVTIPALLTLAYWAAHDPSTIRWASSELQYVVHVLNAWAKAQDSRRASYARAIKRHQRLPNPPARNQEVVEC
jgi:carotenoid cleavage dioxygenase-like enzyme